MTDVSPVLPPSDTPDALSTNVVVVDVPITAPTVVATASAISAPLILGSFPFSSSMSAFADTPISVPIVSNKSTNRNANIDFNDKSEAIPCYVCIIAMPFFYSISEGISMGVITYVALNLITGKAKEKKVSILMYVLAVLFILKYVFL